LLEKINHLLVPGGVISLKDFDMKGSQKRPQMFFCQQDCDDVPIALEDMGTGLSELTILISAIIHDTEKPMQYFIEEPEVHLHPGLLRRFMRCFSGVTNIQFFISSHSNVVLDALDANSRVFYFSQLQNGACTVVPCKGIIAQHRLLDALGVSGSTLLQTNCVIWIEGPSDRLYIRYWLKQLDESLQEGSDYAFAFYGGKILSHFAFEEDEFAIEDFLSMLKISRFSAVIMDKDLPSQSLDKPRETKQRILDEAQSDPAHRLARLTEGREIENDIPIDIFRQACTELLNVDRSRLDNLTLPQDAPYPGEIVVYLGLEEKQGDGKTYKNKLTNKIALASKILDVYEQHKTELVIQPPRYIQDLGEFIKRSRVLSPSVL
jgi:hypothetical protein